jgi:hypothetical protein
MYRLAEAEREYAEALGIYEKLAAGYPERFNEMLAMTLEGQAKLFFEKGERRAEKANLERAAKILNSLIGKGKKLLKGELEIVKRSLALNNFGSSIATVRGEAPLDGYSFLANLLVSQPQFADKCPWEKLKGSDWEARLAKQPQLAGYRW